MRRGHVTDSIAESGGGPLRASLGTAAPAEPARRRRRLLAALLVLALVSLTATQLPIWSWGAWTQAQAQAQAQARGPPLERGLTLRSAALPEPASASDCRPTDVVLGHEVDANDVARLASIGVSTLEEATAPAEAELELLPGQAQGGVFYTPSVPQAVCEPEFLSWHERYGRLAEMRAVCQGALPASPALATRKWRWRRSRSDVPSFGLPVPAGGRRRLLRAVNAVVQREGRVLTESGGSVQGGGCCHCEVPLSLREPSNLCQCARSAAAAACHGCESGSLRSQRSQRLQRLPCPLPRYSGVLSVSTVYGSEYAHFFKESLPRLAPFLDAFNAAPAAAGLVLHIKTRQDGEPERFVLDALRLLGVNTSRVVAGDVLADTVWVPPHATCGVAPDQFWELRALKDRLTRAALRHAGRYEHGVAVLLERHAPGDPRSWDAAAPERYDELARAVEAAVAGRLQVVRVSDADGRLMRCLACQIRLFHKADVVVGMHGAGLTNVMFMPPGGLVVELGWKLQQTEYLMHAHVFQHKYVLHDWALVERGDFRLVADVVRDHVHHADDYA